MIYESGPYQRKFYVQGEEATVCGLKEEQVVMSRHGWRTPYTGSKKISANRRLGYGVHIVEGQEMY